MTDGSRSAAPAGPPPEPVLRRLHPSSLLFHALAFARQFVIPLLVTLLQLRRRDAPWVWWTLAAIVLLFALGALARYLVTRFGLSGEALHVRSGVLSRQARIIPFGRIQSVNVQQSLLQRVLRMSEVRVETATQGMRAEVVLRVLPWREGQALREQLVAGRRRALEDRGGSASVAAASPPVSSEAASPPDALAPVSPPDAGVPVSPPVSVELAARPIVAVDTERLMVAGATSNSVMTLLALLVGGAERVRSSFFADLDLTDGVVGTLAAVQGALGGGVALLLFLMLVFVPLLVGAWVVSVGGAVVRWHGFTLERVGRDLRRRYGLLSRVETSVPVARAQALRYHESLLRRPFGLGGLQLVSAGAAPGQGGNEAASPVLLPILRRSELGALVREVFPTTELDALLATPVTRDPWRRPRPAAVFRLALLETVTVGALLAALAWWRPAWLGAVAWLLPATWAFAWAQHRARGIAVVQAHVLVRSGGLGRSTMILPEEKLQLIEVRQGPVQRLLGTATLRLTTAGVGGDADMVDLPLDDARALQEDLEARLARTARPTPRPTPP